MVEIERANRRQQDAGAQNQRRVDLKIELRGLDGDLLCSVLELQLREEPQASTHWRKQKDVESTELHREPVPDAILDEVVRVRLGVATDAGATDRRDERSVVHASLYERRVRRRLTRRGWRLSACGVRANRIRLRLPTRGETECGGEQ